MSFSPTLAVATGVVVGVCGAVVGVALALQTTGRKAALGRRTLRAVVTDKASPALGHYSQALVSGGQVFVSGLLPVAPDGRKLAAHTFAEQAQQVLRNLKAVLLASGSDLQHLLSVRVYITDIANWATFNQLYADMLGKHKPARAVVPVPVLHYGFLLEVEAVAVQC